MNRSPQFNIREFESSIEAIVKSGDIEGILDVLHLLDDACEYDEAMWSAIHAAEVVADSEYVGGVVRRLPKFVDAAPGWAAVVVARIIKSATCRPLFETEMAEASASARDAGTRILERISAEKPDLAAEANRILAKLRLPP